MVDETGVHRVPALSQEEKEKLQMDRFINSKGFYEYDHGAHGVNVLDIDDTVD